MTDVIFGIGAILIIICVAAVTLIPSIKHRVCQLFQIERSLRIKLVLGLSLVAMLGSLWYSDIIGYEPCRLCWYQRIFMYPIVIISFIGLVYRDLRSLIYARTLAIIGLVISIFHMVQQRIPSAGLSCGTVGQASSCDSLWVNSFGFITIPTMASIIFMAIITVTILNNPIKK